MTKHLLTAAALASALLCSDAASGQPAGTPPFPAALKDADVSLASMADAHAESLIVGNGDLYGIVWDSGSGLTMRVTKNDIWDARVDTSKDPPLPRVNVRTGKVSGALRAPPSYRHPYPQPRCAAVIRLGPAGKGSGMCWSCIRRAARNALTPLPGHAGATMLVAGRRGASNGYRGRLARAVTASALRMTIQGTANASYYVNVYNEAGKNILASGWRRSPTKAEDVILPFPSQRIGQVDVYARTSDGKAATNRLASVALVEGERARGLTFPAAADVRGTLDLHRAVAALGPAGGPAAEIRVLADRNVLLIRSGPPAALEAIVAKTLPAAQTGRSDGVRWLHQVMPGDVDYKGMQYVVALAGQGQWKAVSVVTSFDHNGQDIRKAAIALASQALAEKPADLIAAHERSWRAFWSRSGVALADRDMQRWWYRLLYFARTISRPGAAPPGLMPPLATDATPWHADFHFNYNAWQPFYAVISANHPELADSWISYVHGLLPRAKWLAREGWGCEGVFYSISQFLHEPDPADCTSTNKRQIHMNPWGLTIGMVGMTAQNLWHKHLCQPDPAYLKAKIYPTLREAARFYLSYMRQCRKDKDGRVLLGPSYSPEHGAFGIANCPFDIAYVHYTFDAFCRAAKELGHDEQLARQCRAMKALLADYPVAMDGRGNPVLVDWAGCKYKQVSVHNITVPASPVFPAEQVTWFSSRSVKDLMLRTIRDTRFNGNNSHVMFNIAKARLSMPEAYTNGRAWFTSRQLPNGLFVWKGHAHGTYMAESIGVVALVTEYLMQSVGDTIRVFPCWPADKDAAFSRLRAQGGFLVSAEQTSGRITQVTVESTVGGRLRLLSPWKGLRVDGKPAVLPADGMLELQTRPGQSVRFTPG